MRRAARVDANHAEIVRAFRSIPGVAVEDTSRLGGGFPDLVVSARGALWLVEVKDGRKPPSARRLTPAEEDFARRFAAHYRIVESVADVWRIVGAIRY